MLINPLVPASTPTYTQGTTLQQRCPRPLRIVVRLHLKADAIETTRQGHHRHSTRSPRIAFANDTTMQRWGMLFLLRSTTNKCGLPYLQGWSTTKGGPPCLQGWSPRCSSTSKGAAAPSSAPATTNQRNDRGVHQRHRHQTTDAPTA